MVVREAAFTDQPHDAVRAANGPTRHVGIGAPLAVALGGVWCVPERILRRHVLVRGHRPTHAPPPAPAARWRRRPTPLRTVRTPRGRGPARGRLRGRGRPRRTPRLRL